MKKFGEMKKGVKLAACCALAAGLALTGCGGSSSGSSAGSASESAGGTSSGSTVSGKGAKIGYACVDMNNTFQTYLADAAKEKAKELDASITVTDAQNDVVKQQDQVNQLIQQGVDALIVIPADTSAMQPITVAAQNANIPLVYCNVNPFDSEEDVPENVHYIGSDEEEAGVYQAEILLEEVSSGGAAILQGSLSHEATYKRTEGNENALKDSGVEVLTEETAEWQRDKAIDVTNNWVSAYGDKLTGIIANNDEMALGAVEALKSSGRTDVKVVGLDATPDGCQAVKNGDLLGTVYQDSVGQGGGAVEIAVDMANGNKQDEAMTLIPYQKVTSENVDEFLNK